MSQPNLFDTPEPRSPHRTHAVMISSTSGTIRWAGQELKIERIGYIQFNPNGEIVRLQTQFTQDENETGWDRCTCDHLELAHRVEAPKLGPCTFKNCTCQKYTDEP